MRVHQKQASVEANVLDTEKGSGRSRKKAMDQAPEDKSFGPCMTFKMDRHEDPFIVIQNRVYNDTLIMMVITMTVITTKWAETTMDHTWKTSAHRWQLLLPKASKP